MADPTKPVNPGTKPEEHKVPEVAYPPVRKPTPPEGGNNPPPPTDEDPPLKVKIVSDLNIGALIINLFLALLVFVVTLSILRMKINAPIIYVGVPLSIIWILVVFLKHRLWVSVDTQKGSVCLDSLFSDTITVFPQGLHFMPVWYGGNEYELDFQKHEPIVANSNDDTHVQFQTKDGYTMWADFTGFYQTRCSEEALGRRLRYKDPELKALVRATIKSYLSDLGGLNTYETINAHKGEIANWIAGIFGGEGVLSKFELETGTRLKDPILENLDLDDESKKLWLIRAKGMVVAEMTERLQSAAGSGADANEPLKAAQAVAGVLDRVDSNVRVHVDGKDLPSSLTTLVVGEAGLAVGGNQGKGKK